MTAGPLKIQAEASTSTVDTLHNIKSTDAPFISKQQPFNSDEGKELNR